MVTFPELESWIRAGDSGRLTAALADLDEPSRRSLATQLKGLRLQWNDPELEFAPHSDPRRPHTRRSYEERTLRFQQREGALRVAGAACLPRAADIVSWLRSDRFWQAPLPHSVDAVVQVLRLPGRPSLPAIARSLAEKMRPTRADDQWPLIARLLAEAELPPPATEATLRGWMRRVGADRYRKDLADLLRADPHLESMLPHVFTIPLLGQELDEEWTKALTRLAADGVLDRQALLDGCVLRLHAGDRTGPLRRMVVLHRLLDPTADEFAARRGEYSGMLSSADSTVAELALRGLRLADDAGLLEPDTVAEAAWAVLPRKEKKLVRAQLDWLGAALTRKADPLLFEALLTGLSNPAADLAERALKLAGRHLPAFGPTGLAQLIRVTASLQGDLRRQAASLLPAAPAGPGTPAPTAASTVSATSTASGTDIGASTAGWTSVAASMASGASVAASTVGGAYVGGVTVSGTGSATSTVSGTDIGGGSSDGGFGVGAGFAGMPPVAAPMPDPIASIPELAAEAKYLLYQAEDPIRFELIMDGLVRFVALDRPAVVRALEPIVPQWSSAFANMLRAVVTGQAAKWAPAAWERKAGPPFWMTIRRMEELAEQMCRTPPPALLSTPATVDGHVDPARVLRLLGEGWEPQPYDLAQALLRLPREIDPAIRSAAAGLTSTAGRTFAGFVESGGLPDPTVITLDPGRRCTHQVRDHCGCATRTRRRVVTFDAIKTDLTVQPYLLFQPADVAADRADPYSSDRLAGWPMVFPSHRELAAAHMQPRLVKASEGKGAASDISVLPALAACDGPFGPAMALCLAYGMSAARPDGRLATSDAFVDLAARGVLDGTLVGRELAALHPANVLVLKRVVDTLTQILQAGAATQVWMTLREFLPAVLSAPKPPIGTPDLLLVAESAAAAAAAHDDIPELTAAATRPTRNRVTTEAARLHRTLTSNRPAT
ncbi:DUF7825 domain-containing protein [Actinoplanes xinjiangensis]|uniref:DUF7825 domain-containing protein n=1 Tax=Actinoplanes xinjiangensis TaxID=512350 RepID=A0A316EMR7_9ACTN|nr:DUF6493 family protein [Actinoplanes xinjiangensis]PWK32041.1 hypothetical protein BC793_13136 [Actinoplanes xinjiangensis]GIF43720.1 hypothetical protein Axi01nite_80310 [Actinoplanes xinjiangensis]